MLAQVISRLTRDQKHELAEAGVDRHLLSQWRHGKRLPTEPQAVILAGIAGIDLADLQAQIALARCSEVQRPWVERFLRDHRAVAWADRRQAMNAAEYHGAERRKGPRRAPVQLRLPLAA